MLGLLPSTGKSRQGLQVCYHCRLHLHLLPGPFLQEARRVRQHREEMPNEGRIFLIKKSTSESTSTTGLEPNQKSKKQGKGFQCDQCDLDFKTENGLKIHKGKSHKEVSSPEKKRRSSSKSSLILSPIRDQSRVEPCHNCGMEMSPAHQCQHDQDFTLNEKTEVEASPTCPGHPTYGPCGCTKWNQPCLYRTPDFM